jgi:hypothetical protein
MDLWLSIFELRLPGHYGTVDAFIFTARAKAGSLMKGEVISGSVLFFHCWCNQVSSLSARQFFSKPSFSNDSLVNIGFNSICL